GRAALTHQHIANRDRLLGGVAVTNTRRFNDVGDPEVVQPPLALLEEQNALVACAVVITHADLSLIPDQRLPELEPYRLRDRLRGEHRLLVAEQVEVRVPL